MLISCQRSIVTRAGAVILSHVGAWCRAARHRTPRSRPGTTLLLRLEKIGREQPASNNFLPVAQILYTYYDDGMVALPVTRFRHRCLVFCKTSESQCSPEKYRGICPDLHMNATYSSIYYLALHITAMVFNQI